MPQESSASRRDFLAVAGAGLLASAAARVLGEPLAPPDKQPPNLKLPVDAKKKVAFALVGLGQLCLEEIMPAFAKTEYCQITALVSGHPDKAKALAAHYGVPESSIYNYDDYERMSANPAIDAVYIILPNTMHAEFTVRAFKIGKHVLCEKPMAMTATECKEMIDAGKAANKKLMIAYRLHYEPYNLAVMEMCGKQAYGKVRAIDAANMQQTPAPNIRLSNSTGGGPIGDVGIYCLNAARYITGEEPTEVQAFKFQDTADPRFAEVPSTVGFTLKFPSGAVSTNLCSFDTAESRRYRVYCDNGWINLDGAFGYTGQKLAVFDGKAESTFDLPHVDHFAHEMDHFAQCVMNDKTPNTPGEEGLKDVTILKAIKKSAESGQPVNLA